MTTWMIFESYWGDELPDEEDEELWIAEDSQSSAYRRDSPVRTFRAQREQVCTPCGVGFFP